jgi:hypothetical protein
LFNRCRQCQKINNYIECPVMFYIVGYVKSGRHLERDRAHYELFAWVDEEKIFQRPTYKSRYCFVLHATKVRIHMHMYPSSLMCEPNMVSLVCMVKEKLT